MKIRIIQIGKDKQSYISEALEDFKTRLSLFCDLEIVIIPEVSPGKTFAEERCVFEEGEKILKAIKSGDFIIALDENGKEKSSLEFADFLAKKRDEGSSLCFIIGGAFGLSNGVKKSANLLLSFSRMTFTHQMIRVFLLEQLYRAYSIINGKKYHHE